VALCGLVASISRWRPPSTTRKRCNRSARCGPAPRQVGTAAPGSRRGGPGATPIPRKLTRSASSCISVQYPESPSNPISPSQFQAPAPLPKAQSRRACWHRAYSALRRRARPPASQGLLPTIKLVGWSATWLHGQRAYRGAGKPLPWLADGPVRATPLGAASPDARFPLAFQRSLELIPRVAS
jgi:hypothetical protein